MDRTVGVAELRQDLSVYLRRVASGERLDVTDRNRVVAELGPPPSTGAALSRSASLLTRDRKHFDRIPNLAVVDP